MFVGITCPRCSQALKLPEERVGSQVRCPACRERFAFDAATFATASGDPSTEARMRAAQERSGGMGRASSRVRERIADLLGLQSGVGKGATDVSVLMSGIGGLALTFVLYFGVFMPFQTPMIRALFLVGWVPKAIVFLSSWSLVILIWKFFRVRAQQATILFDALPRELGQEITQGNVERFREHLLSLPPELSSNFLFNRVQRGIDHFRSGRGAQDISATLNSQAELDAMAVDSSYTMLRAFIWAVPILGFIGTVIGIGESVMGFSTSLDQAQNIDVIRNSLGGVTSGLSSAFNTTLIALAASIILMLPAHWLQKLEDDLLNSVSDYTNEELLGRLEEVHEAKDEGTAAIVREVMSAVVDRQKETLDQWTRSLAGVGATLTADVAKGLHKVEQDIQESYKARAEQFGESISQVAARSSQQLEQMTQGLQQTWIQLQDAMSQRVQEMLTKVHDSGLESTREVRETLELSARNQQELLNQLGPAQERHAQAMTEMLGHMQNTVSEVNAGLAGLHDRHAAGLDKLSASLEKNLEALGRQTSENVTEVSSSLAGLQERHEASLDRLSTSLEKNLETLGRQAGEGWTRVESGMQERQRAQVDALGSAITTITDRAREQLEALTRKLQENAAALQQDTAQRCNELLSGLGESGKTGAREVAEALSRTVELQESQQRTLGESLARVDSTAAEMQRNLEAMQRSHAEGLERMTRGLSENLNQLQERAEREGRTRSGEIDEKAGAVRQGMADLERRAGELVAQIGRLTPALEQQLGRLSTDLAAQAKDQIDALNRASQGITGELRSVSENLERTLSSQGGQMDGALSSIREVQSELSRSLPDVLGAQRSALDQSKEQVERLVESQRRLVDNLENLRTDDRLARTLADLGGLAKNLSGDIDGLQRKLDERGVNGNGKGGFRLPFFKRS